MTSSFRSRQLEPAVYRVLTDTVLRPETLLALLEDARPDEESQKLLENNVRQLGSELEQLMTAINRLIDAIEKGGQLPDLVNRLQVRQADKARVESELSDTRQRLLTITQPSVPDAVLEAFCADAKRVLEIGDVQAVRDVLEALVERIIVWPEKRGQLWYRFPIDDRCGAERSHEFTW